MMTEDAAPPVIETRGLSKRYRKVTALGEATISAPPARTRPIRLVSGCTRDHGRRASAGLRRLARPVISEVLPSADADPDEPPGRRPPGAVAALPRRRWRRRPGRRCATATRASGPWSR